MTVDADLQMETTARGFLEGREEHLVDAHMKGGDEKAVAMTVLLLALVVLEQWMLEIAKLVEFERQIRSFHQFLPALQSLFHHETEVSDGITKKTSITANTTE